jgi:ferrous iron transport protein A
MTKLAPIELAAAPQPSRLSDLGAGQGGVIVGVFADPSATVGGVDCAELERRLLEAGFVEGAHVSLLHEGPMGGDPIVVRLDDTRIALRRREAHGIQVHLDDLVKAVTQP